MFRRFLREYLSLTSGERKGFLILLSLVLAMILLRMMLPGLLRPTDPIVAGQLDSLALPHVKQLQEAMYFSFDPNTAGMDTLLLLGLSPKTARTLVNYREHGGRFREKEDLLKIYGLEEKEYLLLEPWIQIHQQSAPSHTPLQMNPFPSPAIRSNHQVTPGFDLNLADTSVLMGINGIGPVFSRRIVKFRELLGGFHSMGQLREVYGLSDEQFNALSAACHADSSRIRMLDLNTAGREELEKHPYLDAYQVSALLYFRTVSGGFKSIVDIRENRLLPPGVFLKISPYLKVAE